MSSRLAVLWGAWRAAALAGLLLLAAGCESKPNPLLRKHGMEALDQRDLQAAEKRFAKAIEQDPTDWKSLYHLGEIRLHQSRLFDAQMLLERALELRRDGPETADILDALAQTLARRGRIERLHTLLDQAIAQRGTSRDHIRKGKHLLKLGDVDEAKLAYRKGAFFAEPGDAYPFVALADFYEAISDTDNAVTALRHAHAIAPRDTAIQQRLRGYGIVPGPTAELPTGKQ